MEFNDNWISNATVMCGDCRRLRFEDQMFRIEDAGTNRHGLLVAILDPESNLELFTALRCHHQNFNQGHNGHGADHADFAVDPSINPLARPAGYIHVSCAVYQIQLIPQSKRLQAYISSMLPQ